MWRSVLLMMVILFPSQSAADENEMWKCLSLHINTAIKCIASDGHNIWCGTAGGVLCYNVKTGVARMYGMIDGIYDVNGSVGDMPQPVTGIMVDGDGVVWASWGKGLASFDGRAWKAYDVLRDVMNVNVRIEYYTCSITSMAVDKDGRPLFSVEAKYNTGTYHGPAIKYGAQIKTFENGEWETLTGYLGFREKSWTYRSLCVDDQGRIWYVKTGSGVHWFDTKEHALSPSWLPAESTNSLALAPDGSLWCSASGGVYRYENEVWTVYQGSKATVWRYDDGRWTPEEGTPLATAELVSLDDLADGKWFELDSYLYCIADEKVVRYSLPPLRNKELGWYINEVEIDAENTLWAATNSALLRFRDGVYEPVVRKTDETPNIDRINDIHVAANGDVWLARPDDYGVYHYDGETWEYVYIPEKAGYAEGRPSCTWITGDSEGNVYFGNNKGLVSYDGAHWNLIAENNEDYGGDYNVRGFLEADREGNIWFLSDNYIPICVYDGNEFHWLMSSYVLEAKITDMFIDHENNKWFGTAYHGIRKYDHSYGFDEGHLFLGKEKFDPDPDKVMRKVAVDFDGVIWYACDEKLKETGEVVEKGLRKIENGVVSDTIELPYVYVTDLEVDKNGVLWVGTKSDGVYKHEDGEFTRYTVKDGLLDNRVDQIAIGPNNEKWFVSQGKGLTLYIDTPSVSVGGGAEGVPETFGLSNHPNPFNPSTTIEFTLPAACDVELTVHSVIGRKVRTLVEGRMPAGGHSVVFDGTGLASGLYFYRLEVGKAVKTGKMMLVR